MKANGTQTIAIAVLLQLLSLIISYSVNAQPKYNFQNSTKISGTDRQVGAIYRFPNVKSGVDALVTITAITGGLTLNQLDGTASGFAEAFQPVITLPAHSKGYVEFNIVFVTAGTATPLIQTEIPVTPIDVDGQAGIVYEFDDIFKYNGGYVNYDMLGGELKVSYPTANIVEGMNTAGIDYGGVDTSAKQVMFTVVNAGISSITVRSGADNKSNQSQQRLRSLYFQKFSYPNALLAQSTLKTFSGNENDNKIDLHFTLNTDHELQTISIERANYPGQFKAIGEVWLTNVPGQNTFNFTDTRSMDQQVYYRLKLTGQDGRTTYSAVLLFRSFSNNRQSLKVFPSIIRGTATVSFKADKSGTALFKLVDYSGKIVKQQAVAVLGGNNNIVINSLDKIASGNYIVLVNIDNNMYNEKVIIQ